MIDPGLLALSASGLIGVALASAAALKGWSGWLELRRLDIARRGPVPSDARPQLGELRARVRRLEAIASGVEH
ncbi:MAG: hypothetical protein ACJ8ER_07160 [Allosphingosinicella sp.]